MILSSWLFPRAAVSRGDDLFVQATRMVYQYFIFPGRGVVYAIRSYLVSSGLVPGCERAESSSCLAGPEGRWTSFFGQGSAARPWGRMFRLFDPTSGNVGWVFGMMLHKLRVI